VHPVWEQQPMSFRRALAIALSLFAINNASAQTAERDASFTWDRSTGQLHADLSYRDILTAPVREKMTRGLPARIVLTGVLYRAQNQAPIATTFQSCKVTWHVWEEMYRIEVLRPNDAATQKHWTPTLTGVVRRCAEAKHLLVANREQVEEGAAVYLDVRILVNPVSKELLEKLKGWVSHPSQRLGAAPGGALFSTFTGLFMK